MPTLQADQNRDIVALKNPPIHTGHDVIVRYSITAPDTRQQQQERIPLNIALVIDRSGSMSGRKLADAVDACRRIVQRLTEVDRCTIVTFDDTATMIADGAPVTQARRSLILHALDMVHSGGSTNLSGGWQLAAAQLMLQQQTKTINHIMLLTDGMANVGITDIESLEGITRDYHHRGISVSTYGLGQGYAENELRRIAEAGHGTHQFIEHARDIERYFSNELSELFTVTYRDVSLRIAVPSGFEAEVIGQLPHTRMDTHVIITIGSMIATEQRTLFLRLTPIQAAVPSQVTVNATLSGVTNDDTRTTVTASSSIQIAPPYIADQAVINQDIEEQAVHVDIAYVRSEAQLRNRGGHYAAARAYVLQMQARSDVFARNPIYAILANEMQEHIDDWRAKISESTNYMKKRGASRDLMYMREKLAELQARGINDTEVTMLMSQIRMLEERRNRRDDDSR